MIETVDIRKWCVSLVEAKDKYPPIREFLNHKNQIDFGNPEALRAYNQAIAKIMFDLDIEVPDTHLIPTICLRYAYVKILNEKYNLESILEIGTGASAIIALIAAKSFHIDVTATEIEEISSQSALRNIQSNELENDITLIRSNGEILKGLIKNSKFDALLTYPPTYPETDRQDYQTHTRKKRGFQGSISEMIGGGTDGFQFIRQLLEEATQPPFVNNIKLLTILCIMEKHVELIELFLKKRGMNISHTFSIQAGNRIRYLVIIELNKP